MLNEFNRWSVKIGIVMALVAAAAVGLAAHVGSVDRMNSVVLIEYAVAPGDREQVRPECQIRCALGSGFYVGDGYLVTAAHVMNGNWSVGDMVITLDVSGREQAAHVLRIDTVLDVAILRYDYLPPIPATAMLCGGQYHVGDAVTARGGPLFLGMTTTEGYIVRLPLAGARDPGMVIFSGAVSHGNSGGPLYDSLGFVVGIVDELVLDDYGSDGGGFRAAIPAKVACDVIADVKRT